MTLGNIPPKFLSIEFHTKFFPALLLQRLRPRKEGGSSPTSFVSCGYIESAVGLALGIVLAVIGLPLAMARGSIIGWIVGGLGLAGILAIFILNVSSRWGIPPVYDYFLVGIFFFFVATGITTGIFIGTLNHSLSQGVLGSLAGLLAGYALGILAGLWFQYLGWIGVLLNALAGVAIIGTLVLDLVLLLG